MTKLKRVSIGVAAMAVSLGAVLSTFTATASATPAYLPTGSFGYSVYACRIPNSQGFNVRVIVSKPANTPPTRAYLRSYAIPNETQPVWGEQSSTTWSTIPYVSGVGTVLEVYGANWYKVSLWEYNPVTGGDVYRKAWTDMVAVGYTPNC